MLMNYSVSTYTELQKLSNYSYDSITYCIKYDENIINCRLKTEGSAIDDSF